MIDRLKSIPAEFTLPLPQTNIEDLEQENRLMRARNERLEKIVAGIVPRLEMAFGAKHAAPIIAKKFIEEQT